MEDVYLAKRLRSENKGDTDTGSTRVAGCSGESLVWEGLKDVRGAGMLRGRTAAKPEQEQQSEYAPCGELP